MNFNWRYLYEKTKLCSKLLSLVLMLSFSFSFSTNAFAEQKPLTSEVSYFIDFNDNLYDSAKLLSESSEIKNGRITTKSVYELSDGRKLTDTFEYSLYAPFSLNGSDTATRTRDLDDWGSISITASFKWRTAGRFSYVKCTSVSTSKNLSSNAVVNKWDVTKTSEEVTIGRAKASVDYYMYNKQIPVQYRKGNLTIWCSDSGTISDNG